MRRALIATLLMSLLLASGCSDTTETPTETPSASEAALPTTDGAPSAGEATQPATPATSTSSVTPSAANPTQVPPTSAPGVPAITKDVYLDDRSGPVQTLSSFFNAINRKEYARAYSYWETTEGLPAFQQFAQGYAQTESVEITLGTISTYAGAGQVYYSVPATLIARNSDGSTQTFVSCYRLHLANPGIQAQPPFKPLGITLATMKEVTNNTDTTADMQQICQASQ
ncbi:MAG: hypothetical protein M1546_04080 [Chloroflexi bacterium]|nr:hypothetical protein [Chloroflexota bacterium]